MDIAECDYEVNYDCKNTLNWIATFMAKYISKGGGLPEFYYGYKVCTYNLYLHPTICTLQFVPYSLYLQFVPFINPQVPN